MVMHVDTENPTQADGRPSFWVTRVVLTIRQQYSSVRYILQCPDSDPCSGKQAARHNAADKATLYRETLVGLTGSFYDCLERIMTINELRDREPYQRLSVDLRMIRVLPLVVWAVPSEASSSWPSFAPAVNVHAWLSMAPVADIHAVTWVGLVTLLVVVAVFVAGAVVGGSPLAVPHVASLTNRLLANVGPRATLPSWIRPTASVAFLGKTSVATGVLVQAPTCIATGGTAKVRHDAAQALLLHSSRARLSTGSTTCTSASRGSGSVSLNFASAVPPNSLRPLTLGPAAYGVPPAGPNLMPPLTQCTLVVHWWSSRQSSQPLPPRSRAP